MNLFRKIWNDPVWSKVIGIIIASIIMAWINKFEPLNTIQFIVYLIIIIFIIFVLIYIIKKIIPIKNSNKNNTNSINTNIIPNETNTIKSNINIGSNNIIDKVIIQNREIKQNNNTIEPKNILIDFNKTET